MLRDSLLLVLASSVVGSSAPRMCSVRAFPEFRPASATVLLGRLTGETAPAPPSDVDTSPLPGHQAAFGVHLAFRIRVARLGGAHQDTLAAVLAATRDSTVWVVPWGRDPTCYPVPWRSSRDWAPIDSLGTSQLRLRPPSAWHGGRPTFDAFGADRAAYPHGIYFRTGYPDVADITRGEGLSAEEYFDLLTALPPVPPSAPRSDPLPRQLQEWADAHPALAAKLPASRILAAWRPRD
jgi:hypothetical protein